MDIICRERSCVYNKGFSCTSRRILIGKDIICTNYEKNTEMKKIPNTSKEMFNKQPPKYKSHRESKKGCIHCESNCMFRCDNTCEANGITVNCLKNKPYCVTYFEE